MLTWIESINVDMELDIKFSGLFVHFFVLKSAVNCIRVMNSRSTVNLPLLSLSEFTCRI